MTTQLTSTADKVFFNTYARFPLVMTRGEGSTLWDEDGNRYTDFVAGIAVCSLGHAHPQIADALYRQAQELLHVSNLYYTVPQTKLAELLTANSFADRVFLCNSGAEANEAAIKLARRHFSESGSPERHRIIAMERSFHGRTMGALSATGQDKIKQGFAPVLQGFAFAPFGDLDGLAARMDETVAAVLLEPVQGEGGVRVPSPDYLSSVRRLCDDHGALLIFDEIQTGMGRIGTLFAYQQFGTQPDIMTLAKALGNGLPIGAMLAGEKIAPAFGPGSHGSTFGGTPIITAAACEVLRIMTAEGFMEEVAQTGRYFRLQLEQLKETHASVMDVRGCGLLLGLKLDTPGGAIVDACRRKGLLINCVQERILRFIPPLTITTEEIDRLVDCLDGLL